jgi:glycerophosphoryl diester phosphodiesterase
LSDWLRLLKLHVTDGRGALERVRRAGFGIHTYEVNDEDTISRIAELGIERFDTDALTKALAMRQTSAAGGRTRRANGAAR